jgi:hypothetical protein
MGKRYLQDVLETRGEQAFVGRIVTYKENGHEKKLKVGDHVSWNSEAGRVSGKIIKVHRKDIGGMT